MQNIYNILSKDKGILLGKNVYLPVDKRGNTNSLVVGGSGSGKSAAFIIPNIKNMLGSYVITDPLGEQYKMTHEFLEKNGYEVKTIGIENSNHNYNYDPFNHINNDDDVNKLAEFLIGDEPDDFWKESSKALLKTVIFYILEKAEKKDLLTLFYLLSTNKEILFEKFNEFEECSKGAKYAALLKTFPEKTYLSIASTAIMKISFVIDKISDDREFKREFDFYELKEKKMAIFIGFNESNKEDLKIVNLAISQILSQLKSKDNVKEQVYFLIDGIGMFGKIQNLSSSILMARPNKLSIHLISNSINVLQIIYGDDFYSMLNSIDTQILLGTNLKNDYEYFGELFSIDPRSIKENWDNDKLLISEKGLEMIEAKKDYFFNHKDWMNF